MLQENIQSSSQPTNSRVRSTRNRNFPKRLMDQQTKDVNNRVKVKPSSLVTCINDSSISVLTTDTSVLKSHVIFSKLSANIVIVKRKGRKNVLTNSSTKKIKKKMIKVIIKHILVVKKFHFIYMICVNPILWKNNSKKQRMKVH